jgi:transaldolase
LDNICASLVQSGDLRRMVEKGVIVGMTSNPTIFAKAVGSGAGGYDKAIRALHRQGKSTFDKYDEVTRRDIAEAADILRPIYDRTEGLDGYVSLEVSPELAHEEDRTVNEALRLFRALERPNVMIKVPATDEGTAAVRRLIADGVNVNVTLIFSPATYRKVVFAYIEGLRERSARSGDVSRVSSVASFFVSRIDTAVDSRLDALKAEGKIPRALHKSLRGKMAVANAKMGYQDFKRIFDGPDFEKLAQRGARPQRVLWASTSTKDPAYADLKYVEALIGPRTVNTMPSETLEAFLDHGRVNPKALETRVGKAAEQFRRLAEAGIDFEDVCADLLDKGIEAFAKSFRELLHVIRSVR